MDGQVDEAIAVEIDGDHVGFMFDLRNVDADAVEECALAIPLLKGNSVAVFMKPISPAIAIEIDEGVGAAAIGADRGLDKTERAWLGTIDPPAACAVVVGDQEIHFSVFIDVGGE